jgi:hypothetical protein
MSCYASKEMIEIFQDAIASMTRRTFPAYPRRLTDRTPEDKLINRYKCSNESIVVACIYMSAYRSQYHAQGIPVNLVYQVMVAALVLAIKMCEDIHYSNAAYASGAKMTVTKLNTLERRLLSLLSYDLLVGAEEFDRMLELMYKGEARSHQRHYPPRLGAVTEASSPSPEMIRVSPWKWAVDQARQYVAWLLQCLGFM